MEQLEDIKENDEFWVRVRIDRIDDIGVWFRFVFPNGQADIAHDYVTSHRHLFTEKITRFSQCAGRKFKKGDKVRIVVWNGRTCLRDGQIGFVVRDEDNSGMVELSIDGWKNGVFYHACKLELISTIEERSPYYVEHNTKEKSFDICRMYGDRPVVRQSFFYAVGAHEGNAELTETEAKKEATEACERLNAEYSKVLDT